MALHRVCSVAFGLVERKNELWSGLFFLFLLVTKRLYGKEEVDKNKSKKHIKVGNMKKSNLVCGKVAIGGTII